MELRLKRNLCGVSPHTLRSFFEKKLHQKTFKFYSAAIIVAGSVIFPVTALAAATAGLAR